MTIAAAPAIDPTVLAYLGLQPAAFEAACKTADFTKIPAEGILKLCDAEKIVTLLGLWPVYRLNDGNKLEFSMALRAFDTAERIEKFVEALKLSRGKLIGIDPQLWLMKQMDHKVQMPEAVINALVIEQNFRLADSSLREQIAQTAERAQKKYDELLASLKGEPNR